MESRIFREVKWSNGVSGKHGGVMGVQERTVESRIFRKIIAESWGFRKVQFESRGFRKAQRSHGFSGEYSRVLGFQERTVESRSFRKVQ